MLQNDQGRRRTSSVIPTRVGVNHLLIGGAALVFGDPHARRGEPFPYRFRTILSVKVLDFVQLGGPSWIRTTDLALIRGAL